MYFDVLSANIVTNLTLRQSVTLSTDILCDTKGIVDPVFRAIEKYKEHPLIKSVAPIGKNNFTFEEICFKEILVEEMKTFLQTF